jgi:hypothetical protein
MASEKSIAHRLKQVEKSRVLRELIAEGMKDIAAGRVCEWDLGEFLSRARAHD